MILNVVSSAQSGIGATIPLYNIYASIPKTAQPTKYEYKYKLFILNKLNMIL